MQHNSSYWPGANPNMFTPQYTPYNQVPASPFPPALPEVSGEGELISIVFPDGTLQFFFIPTIVQWTGNVNYNNPNQAWRVKTISNNPIPASIFSQYYPHVPNISQCSPMEQSFSQKFHNDGCSSTTDLHYFYPNQRTIYPKINFSQWLPKVDTSVQMTSQNRPREMQYEMVNPGCLDNMPSQDYRRAKPKTENMVVDEQTYERHRRSIMCPVKREKKYRSKEYRSETSFSSETRATSGSETEKQVLHSTGEQTCRQRKQRKRYKNKYVVTYTDQISGNNGCKSTNTAETTYNNSGNCKSVETNKESTGGNGTNEDNNESTELFAESLVDKKFGNSNNCTVLKCSFLN